jgi:hypothetical protein
MSASIQFNAVVFEEAIHRELANDVKGYSCVITDKTDIQAKVSGGWAQAPDDGNVPMKTYISSCIGSVSKVLSAIALLQLFNQHKLEDGSVQEQLDMHFWDKLPPKWRQTLAHKNLEEITYRQLLQHKSGILHPDQANPPYAIPDQHDNIQVYYVLSRGVTGVIGERRYSNYNISLLLYLIPAIAYPAEVAQIHPKYQHLDAWEYAEAIRQEYGPLYEKYMRTEIFAKTLEPIAPTCRPALTLSVDRYAKWYADKDDRTGNVFQRTSYCPPQGSWYISAQELAHFVRTFAFTDRYIGPTTRASLYDPSHPDDRIVFGSQSLLSHPGVEEETGQRLWAYHGGDQEGYHAALVKLPHDYYGIGMVNSDGKGSNAIARTLLDAFYDATRGQPISLAKHGMPEAQYQKYVTELGKHGSYPDWLDFYNVGTEVYVNAIWWPASNPDWLARHDLTGAEYQTLFNTLVQNGPYRLKQIDSYMKNGQINYAVVMVKGSSANMPAYHGATATEHQQRFDDFTAQGFVPVNISVTSLGGQRFYTAFYTEKAVAGLVVHSALTAEQYQALVNAQTEAGGEIAYLHTYNHNGEIFYSAIFESNPDRAQVLRHNLSPTLYQQEFDKWIGQGFSLKLVTAAASGNNHCYAAVWQQ